MSSITSDPDPDAMLRLRGVSFDCDAFVTSLAFTRASKFGVFALGSGSLLVLDLSTKTWTETKTTDGAILTVAADFDSNGILAGGDDGSLVRLEPGGVSQLVQIGKFPTKWVEHVTSIPDKKNAIRVVAVGKTVHLLGPDGATLRTLDHSSTVTGLVLDAKMRRIGTSHYNGASIWFVRAEQTKPQLHEWKGSHIGIAIHPAFTAVVTGMQENALHGWRMPDGQHMRMSGYSAKPQSIGFSASGRWLASSGAESIILWPFFGGGPMGKAPVELAGRNQAIVRHIACHPGNEVVAAGFSDGMVVVADIVRERILPIASPGRGSVSALGWSPDGSMLGFGTEAGFAAVVDFTSRLEEK